MTDTQELTITRLIDAPREAVWRAWAEHMDEWFCPRPWTSKTIACELRAGGRSEIVMRGPNGEEQHLTGTYLEVVPGERVVVTDAFGPGWMPQGPFMVAISEFADEDNRTRYTARARHWTAEAADQHRAMGFEQGWGAVAAQLEEVARRLA